MRGAYVNVAADRFEVLKRLANEIGVDGILESLAEACEDIASDRRQENRPSDAERWMEMARRIYRF